jgi:hypothetical protein
LQLPGGAAATHALLARSNDEVTDCDARGSSGARNAGEKTAVRIPAPSCCAGRRQ